MGYLKSIGTGFIYLGLILALITFLPGLPPHNVRFEEYSIAQPAALKDKLALEKNDKRLQKPEKLFDGVIFSPECFSAFGDDIYTGLQGDGIVRITEKGLVPVVNFGKKPCEHVWKEEECGKPLGMQFDKQGNMYAVDPYFGIFKVDVKSGKHEKIIDLNVPIDGKKPLLCNSLDVASNGDIYWTESTTEVILNDAVYSLLSNPSGRFLRYNAATKKNEVLIENLGFANGVKLSKNEDFVIVAETLNSRIQKYNIRGPNAGKSEIFVEGLPGLPDNLHSDGLNGFLVTMVTYIDEEHPLIPQVLMPHPNLRKMLARVHAMIELPFKMIQKYMPNFYTDYIVHFLGSFHSVMWLGPDVTAVLRLDENGKIVDAAYVTGGVVSDISSAFIHKGYLWLGSFSAKNIARVHLSQAFPDLARIENLSSGVAKGQAGGSPKVEDVKPTEKPMTTTQKPSTTTSKPQTTKAPPVKRNADEKNSKSQGKSQGKTGKV